MNKLSDLQCLLLSHASQREDGALLPWPASVDPRGAVKAMGALVRKGLVEDRSDGDYHDVVPFITPAGLAAIGVEEAGAAPSPAPPAGLEPAAAVSFVAKGKTARVVDLLRREGGATITDMIEVTDWLPHSCRAALTGLRKKGHAIERFSREGVTCYRLGAA